MRLIDADKLKAHYAWLDYGTTLTKADVDAIVDAQPTVDAAPVVRGAWRAESEIRNEWGVCRLDTFYNCSICDFASDYNTKYCPNCGARMDKGATDG